MFLIVDHLHIFGVHSFGGLYTSLCLPKWAPPRYSTVIPLVVTLMTSINLGGVSRVISKAGCQKVPLKLPILPESIGNFSDYPVFNQKRACKMTKNINQPGLKMCFVFKDMFLLVVLQKWKSNLIDFTSNLHLCKRVIVFKFIYIYTCLYHFIRYIDRFSFETCGISCKNERHIWKHIVIVTGSLLNFLSEVPICGKWPVCEKNQVSFPGRKWPCITFGSVIL